MPIKLVFGFPNGRSVQKDFENNKLLYGKKIGDELDGNLVGYEGYHFKIMGGSDDAGFPMRADIHGIGRKKILAVKGVGLHKIAQGIKKRKTVAGGVVGPHVVQLNLKVLKEGKEALLPPEKAKTEAEKPAEEKKP
jgi:small subunit ribosomal protein S6e